MQRKQLGGQSFNKYLKKNLFILNYYKRFVVSNNTIKLNLVENHKINKFILNLNYFKKN